MKKTLLKISGFTVDYVETSYFTKDEPTSQEAEEPFTEVDYKKTTTTTFTIPGLLIEQEVKTELK